MESVKAPRATMETSLAAILCHPTRVRCFVAFAEGKASPAQLERRFGLPVSHIGYHVKVLRELGVIELVETKPRRGAIEHLYVARVRPMADDEEWAKLPIKDREEFTRFVLHLHVTDLAKAMDDGSFDRRHNRYLVRFPGAVDEQGFDELNALHAELYERTMAIYGDAASRIADGADRIPVMTTSMFYETPDRSPDPE